VQAPALLNGVPVDTMVRLMGGLPPDLILVSRFTAKSKVRWPLMIGATTTIATSGPIEKPTYTTVRIKDRAGIEKTFFFLRYSENNFFHSILAFRL
jgi:hypothetical protein